MEGIIIGSPQQFDCLRLKTVFPWLSLVAPSNFLIFTLTFEKVIYLTPIMGKTVDTWAKLLAMR